MQDWLLALLRYAVTRCDADRSAALAIAEAIDVRGGHTAPSSFDFFRRTSLELCKAISGETSHDHSVIVRRHLDRIEDVRLRRAFAAAVEVELEQPTGEIRKPRRSELWRGLA
jgi:hypothetical protein